MQLKGDAKSLHCVNTGFWSLDQAFANRKGRVGFPVRGICELYGRTYVGKSTISYGLAGRIATALNTNIALADFELYDPDSLQDMFDNAGYCGIVESIYEEKDEKMLDALIDRLRSPEYSVGILDSLGAISPISDEEGNIGDANMGRRAKIAAQLARRITKAVRDKAVLHDQPCILFIINHQLNQMGTKFAQGTTTSGGDVKKNLATERLCVRVLKTYDDGSTLIVGKVEKNRFGFGRRSFYLFNLAGWGIHPGLTAIHDCINTGLAEQERTIKLDGKSFGYFSAIIERADDAEMFRPFQDALANFSGAVKAPKSKDEEDE